MGGLWPIIYRLTLWVRFYPNGTARSSQAYRLAASWGVAAQGEEPAVVDWGKPEVEAPQE
jgi:hypothetical protein